MSTGKKYYVGYSGDNSHHQVFDFQKDIGDIAYIDRGRVVELSDILTLGIGSHYIDVASWDNIQNAPIRLPSKGHLQVFLASPDYRKIQFTCTETQDAQDGSIYKSALLEKINGVWRDWTYLSDGSAQEVDNSYYIPTAWTNGLGANLFGSVFSKKYITENASLNRDSLGLPFDFNKIILPGFYEVSLSSFQGSSNFPPNTLSNGKLEVKAFGCTILQYYYPYNSNYTGLYFRELGQTGIFSQWYSSVEGNMDSSATTIDIPTYYTRGIGHTKIPIYKTSRIDTLTSPQTIRSHFQSGFGISIINGVISWTGVTQSISALAPIYINSSNQIYWQGTTTHVPEGTGLYYTDARARAALSAGVGINYNSASGVISSSITQYTDALARASIGAGGLLSYNSITGIMSLPSVPWTSITGAPSVTGYVPLSRVLTLYGTDNTIVVLGGSQSLAADRGWSIDLALLHASPLSGGTATSVPQVVADRYGRVTAISNIGISFPVTSVNGQTGAVVLNTDNITEGITNKYYTDTRVQIYGDGRYSQLGHNHNDLYPQLAITYGNPSWIGTLAWSKITGAPAFLTSFTETDPTVPSWVKAITTTNISNWNTAFGWGNHATMGYLTTLPAHNHDDRYPQLAITYSNPSWVGSLAWSKITNPPTTVVGYGITDALSGSGTTNYVSKFTGSTTLGNSQIHDNGTNVGVGGTASGHKLRVVGAIRADGDGASVGLYMAAGTAIRAESTLFVDANGPVYFRGNSGASYLMEMQTNGGIRFNAYYNTNQFQGTAAGLFAFDTSGNVLTYEAVRTNAQNDARYSRAFVTTAPIYYNTGDGNIFWAGNTNDVPEGARLYYTNVRARAAISVAGGILSYDNTTGAITLLSNAFDGRYPQWGDVYTRTQLNTSGAGGAVHWNNITNAPSFLTSFSESDPTVAWWIKNITQANINQWNSALTSLPVHSHPISEVTNLWSELNNRPQWGDVYTRTQLNTSGAGGAVHWNNITNAPSFLTSFSESDPFGFDSHWFSVSGSTVTLGIQRRNGTQSYANFVVPVGSESDPKGVDYHTLNLSGLTLEGRIFRRDGTSSYTSVNLKGPLVTNLSGHQNNIDSQNFFNGLCYFYQPIEAPYGIRMGGALFVLQNVNNSGSTPSISNDVIPVVINGVTRYILLKS